MLILGLMFIMIWSCVAIKMCILTKKKKAQGTIASHMKFDKTECLEDMSLVPFLVDAEIDPPINGAVCS